jgi:hypothetical protein
MYAKGNRDKLPSAGSLGFVEENEDIAASIFNKKQNGEEQKCEEPVGGPLTITKMYARNKILAQEPKRP